MKLGSFLLCFTVRMNEQFCIQQKPTSQIPESMYFGTFMIFPPVPCALIWQRTRDRVPCSSQQAYCVREVSVEQK